MPYVTMVFATILIALGLVGYLVPSSSPNASVPDSAAEETAEADGADSKTSEVASSSSNKTALIPSIFGVLLLISGTLALKKEWLKHAMHAAAMVALVGGIAGGVRVLMKIGPWLTGDPTVNGRAMQFTVLMTVVCLIFVGFCINSFIAARRARQATQADA